MLFDIVANFLVFNQKRAEWLANGGVEAQWDEYLKGLKDRGLDQYMEINQRVYTNAYGE